VAEGQNRLVLVGRQENLGPFFSTDGKISIRMVTLSFYFAEEENIQK